MKRGWNIVHPVHSDEAIDHKIEHELRSFSSRLGHPYEHVRDRFYIEWNKVPIAKRLAFERGLMRGTIQGSYLVLGVLSGVPELSLANIITHLQVPRVPRHKLKEVI
jgi:hypothetical protein